jgi:hypothetical protein
VFHQFHAKATITLHAVEEVSTQSSPKSAQITKGTMVDIPEKITHNKVSIMNQQINIK